jgi:RNA polymerase sigma-70 factor (ECF subfamily)
MGLDVPPPDWQSRDDRDLERLFACDDLPGAQAAFVELRRRFVNELRAQALRRCGGSQGMFEEAMQRLDARAWEKRRLYKPERGRWIAWAKTVLRNIIVQMIRDLTRDQGCGELPEQLPAHEPAADWRLKLAELKAKIGDCLRNLKPKERRVLILRTLKGVSYQRLGEQAGQPWQTISTRVHRAKKKLRKLLEGKGYDGGEL